MNKQTETALKMAIEAMEKSKEAWHQIGIYDDMYDGLVSSIQACKEALEQPAPSWQGLSDDEIDDIADNKELYNSDGVNEKRFARAIEQTLKEKNNG